MCIRDSLQAAPPLVLYREWVVAVGLGYRVTPRAQLTLPAYSGALALAHARAVTP